METAVHDTSGSEGFSLRWSGWFCDGAAPAHVPQLCWLMIFFFFFLHHYLFIYFCLQACATISQTKVNELWLRGSGG